MSEVLELLHIESTRRSAKCIVVGDRRVIFACRGLDRL